MIKEGDYVILSDKGKKRNPKYAGIIGEVRSVALYTCHVNFDEDLWGILLLDDVVTANYAKQEIYKTLTEVE